MDLLQEIDKIRTRAIQGVSYDFAAGRDQGVVEARAVVEKAAARVRELEEENQRLRDTVSAAQKAVDSAGDALAFSPRDWGLDHRDAWLYAILLGWACEDDHDHDHACEGNAALTEIADRHQWDEATVARVTRHRAAITQLDLESARDIAKEDTTT